MKIVVIGGSFNDQGGRPSGYITKFADAICADVVVNGGTFMQLDSLRYNLSDVTHLFWMADVPNSYPKILPNLIRKNPQAILIQSKNNRDGAYTAVDLYHRMHRSGAEFLIEFARNDDDKICAAVLAINGIVTLAPTEDIDILADHLLGQFYRISKLAWPLRFKTDIPTNDHAGAFGMVRKHHIHEGIDLYCENGDSVYAIEDGIVVGIHNFTGIAAGSPWWNDTVCVMIEGKSGVINYGELHQCYSLIINGKGHRIERGDLIGQVSKVLKHDKGLPMSMLHLERYMTGTKEPIKEWTLDTPQPRCLLNPTTLLCSALRNV